MNDDNETVSEPSEAQDEPVEPYDRPAIIDYGTLSELTLSGLAPQTDSLLGAGS